MPIAEAVQNSFKSEVQASGRKLVAQEKVALSGGSDTGVQAYIQASPPVRVTLSSSGIASRTFTAACNCSAARKAQFCKHVWATVLSAEAKYPDFFAKKVDIEKPATSSDSSDASENSYQTLAKGRASDYRKEQYKKQKAQIKEKKQKLRGRETAAAKSFPDEVTAALAYFSLNGFPMEEGPDENILSEAKRKLSRIFHPDKGGTHEETVELNRNCEVLIQFLRGA